MASINAGTGIVNTGDNSGVLDIQGGGVTGVSVNVNGMYVKSVTTTQMNALTAVNGMIVFNTTLAKMCQYVNGAWQQMTSVAPPTGTQRAIFGYGTTSQSVAGFNTTNLVSNTGVVATDTTGAGTARNALAAAGYGGDKAIFGYGNTASNLSITNLVSNTGVVGADVTGVGTARNSLAATKYGADLALFGYGFDGTVALSLTNLVSNTGVVAANTTGVGTTRFSLAATGYGGDKAIFGYGRDGAFANVSMTNLVSNTGVVATDTTGVGTARRGLAAAGYSTT